MAGYSLTMRDTHYIAAITPKIFTQPIASPPTLDASKVADGLPLKRVSSFSVSLSAADAAQKLNGVGTVTLYFWEPAALGRTGAWLPFLPALDVESASATEQGQHFGEIPFSGHLEDLVVYPVARGVTLSGTGSGDTQDKVLIVLRPSSQ